MAHGSCQSQKEATVSPVSKPHSFDFRQLHLIQGFRGKLKVGLVLQTNSTHVNGGGATPLHVCRNGERGPQSATAGFLL